MKNDFGETKLQNFNLIFKKMHVHNKYCLSKILNRQPIVPLAYF